MHHRKTSTTDPESVFFHKGEHEKCFTYSVDTARDCHDFVLNFDVGYGNSHDGKMIDKLYNRLLI